MDLGAVAHIEDHFAWDLQPLLSMSLVQVHGHWQLLEGSFSLSTSMAADHIIIGGSPLSAWVRYLQVTCIL